MQAWRVYFFGVGSLLLVLAPAAKAEAPSTATMSAQQIYDQAQVAFDKADWAAAISGFTAIAKPAKEGKLSHSQGIIHSRLAQAYAHDRDAGSALREANVALTGLSTDEFGERAALWLAIAYAQRIRLQMSEAASSYARGEEAAVKGNLATSRIEAEAGLVQVYMTVDPEKAKSLADALLTELPATADNKSMRAQFLDLRGRASLNLGQPTEAMGFLRKAVELSGGLYGDKVNLLQVAIRGDAALAALMTNDSDEARRYMAWTGAGHLPSTEWEQGLADPPVCSESADIHADDMVIVEFSIAENGAVVGAAPIYATRPGTLGTQFARAVSEWHWNPERIAKLPSFWRNMLRLELRCRTRPAPEQLAGPFWKQTAQWLFHLGLSRDDLAPMLTRYVAADDARLQRDDPAALPALLVRLVIETDPRRQQSIGEHLSSALDKAKAPAAARAVAMDAMRPNQSIRWTSEYLKIRAANAAKLQLTDPESAASAWMTLEYAIALEANRKFKEAVTVLERVVAYPMSTLAEQDPVRSVATLHLAALQRRAGDSATADAHLMESGLTRAQCLLFDVRPMPAASLTSSIQFPDDANRWGFDGYVRESFDIAADGHVENVRTVLAYPPFVFSSATEKSAARLKYIAPVVEGGAAGCDGHSITIKYQNWAKH